MKKLLRKWLGIEEICEEIKDIVSCEECGVLIEKHRAQIIPFLNNGYNWCEYYCKNHKRNYNKAEVYMGKIIYYKNTPNIAVDKNGKPIK